MNTTRLTATNKNENQKKMPRLKSAHAAATRPTRPDAANRKADHARPCSGASHSLALRTSPLVPQIIHATPVPARPRRKIRRNGRIACLPKLERDMVNRMIWNGVPYKNIVEALLEAGFTVTERNISNWATGGHLEWRLEQEAVLQNRLDQDHLLDFLRRDDASELPEVGLQAAATRLSQVLLKKLASADDPEAHLDTYSRMVDLLCRLNREVAACQKSRDDARRTLGPEYDPTLVKDVDQTELLETERYFSEPPPDSELPKPSEPPMLPPTPTATILAEQAREQREAEESESRKHRLEMLKAQLQSKKPSS